MKFLSMLIGSVLSQLCYVHANPATMGSQQTFRTLVAGAGTGTVPHAPKTIYEKATGYQVDGAWKILRHIDDLQASEQQTFQRLQTDAEAYARSRGQAENTVKYFAESTTNGQDPVLVRYLADLGWAFDTDLQRYNPTDHTWQSLKEVGRKQLGFFIAGRTKAHEVSSLQTDYDEDGFDDSTFAVFEELHLYPFVPPKTKGDGAVRMHDKAMCYKVDGTWKIVRHMSEDLRPQEFESLKADAEQHRPTMGNVLAYYAERTVNGEDPVLVRYAIQYRGQGGGTYSLDRYNPSSKKFEELDTYGVTLKQQRYFVVGRTQARKEPGSKPFTMLTVYNDDGLGDAEKTFLDEGSDTDFF